MTCGPEKYFMNGSKLPNRRRWKKAIFSQLDRDVSERLLKAMRAKYFEISSVEQHPAAAKEHLKEILPSVALHLSAREIGVPIDVSLEIIKLVAMENAKVKARYLKAIKYLPGSFRLFRIFSPRILKRDFEKAGFKVEWVENSQNRIAFNINKCLYVDLFRKYDCIETCQIYCSIDDFWYEPLAPVISWKRTGTLARGAKCCDFRFHSNRGRAGIDD